MESTAVVYDAHPLWLDAVEEVLRGLGVKVAAKTTRAEEALDSVRVHQPELLVLEPGEGSVGSNGHELMRAAGDACGGLRIVALSASQDAASVDAAFVAGAVAYVFKSAHPQDLASAIRQAFDVSLFLSPIHGATQQMPRESSRKTALGLTKREVEILQLVSEGHSNGELARMLWVTEQTVKFHLSNIYRKLNVANRTEASRWAQINGLLEAPVTAYSAA